ncbi:hypothetical protein F0U62_06235 [Cystobacter fuscus]|uniref:hypothetical protein n=1 Tax=Cystobacter fuscus TaxID=43 RepID=UPI002B2BF757|nr:hypothetical protein F0U62_06235 [Cystobacter fuscus]
MSKQGSPSLRTPTSEHWRSRGPPFTVSIVRHTMSSVQCSSVMHRLSVQYVHIERALKKHASGGSQSSRTEQGRS